MSSWLQNAGHLKENDFSLEIFDGFRIFWWRIIETTLLHSFTYGFLQSLMLSDTQNYAMSNIRLYVQLISFSKNAVLVSVELSL